MRILAAPARAVNSLGSTRPVKACPIFGGAWVGYLPLVGIVDSQNMQLQRAHEIGHRVATSLSLQHIQIHEPSIQVQVCHGNVRQELH